MNSSGICYHGYLLAAGLLVACAPSGPPAPTAKPLASTEPARPVWPQFARLQQLPVVAQGGVESGGHAADSYSLQVRVSGDAQQAYLSLTQGSALPAGSLVAQAHRDASGHAGPIFVMLKDQRPPEDWSYLVLDADGHVLRQGALPDCARCHAEAVADRLFGPAR